MLADDDLDDCLCFKEALEELSVNATLTTVNDGEQLMQWLSQNDEALPDALYLDLNMPRKNGFECLAEIKQTEKLKSLPVIICSTSSFDSDVVSLLYEQGASYYICKPPAFSNLKKIILKSIQLLSQANNEQPIKEQFVLSVI